MMDCGPVRSESTDLHEVPSSALRVAGVTHRFGERLVLDDVDLEIAPGRVVGLLGPNGAGKTTLMRIIFGVIQPDVGRILFDGRPAGPGDRRTWGYMPQERGVYDDMRVLDLLVWFARLHDVPKAEARRRAVDLLERLGLADRSHDAISDLSGGMVQRVQLAAAMVHQPPLLVLDEPFAGLDPAAVQFLSDVIVDHVRAGRHLLLSSHQLDLVEDLCETIFLLHRGRVVLQGEVATVKANSNRRYLQVDAPVEPAWVTSLPAVIAERNPAGTRLRLEPAADAVAVLSRIRDRTDIRTFGVETPSLSELFLAATAEQGDGGSEPGPPSTVPTRADDRSAGRPWEAAS